MTEPHRPNWEAVITVELRIDDQPVSSYRERRGAFMEHVGLDKRALRQTVGGMARRSVDRIAREVKLL